MKNGSKNPRTGKMIKRLLVTFGSLLVLLVIFAGMLPALVSSSWGKNYLANFLGQKIESKVVLDELSLSWFGSQEIKGLKISDAKDQNIFSCNAITSDASLWNILIVKHDFGMVKISSPALRISKEFRAVSNVQKMPLQQAALVYIPPLAELFKQFTPDFTGSVIIADGAVQLASPGLDPITFQNIQLLAQVPRGFNQVSLALQAETLQQNTQGQIAINAKIEDMRAAYPQMDCSISCKSLPVRGIDQIMALFHPELGGILVSGLGATLDVSWQSRFSDKVITSNLTALSPNLNAQLAVKTEGGEVSLSSPGKITLTVTPDFVKKFSKAFPAFQAVKLNGSTALTLTLGQLSCPLPQKWSDFEALALQAAVDLASSQWTIGTGNLSLDKLNLSLSCMKLQNGLNMQGSVVSHTEDVTTKIVFGGSGKGSSPDNLQADLSFEAKSFSMVLLDELTQGQGKLPMLLGQTVDFSGKAKLSLRECLFTLQASSPIFSLAATDLKWDGGLHLIHPASLSYALSQISSTPELQIASADPVAVTISTLEIPAAWEKMQLKAEVKLPQANFSRFFGINPLQVKDLSCQLQVATLDNSLKLKGQAVIDEILVQSSDQSKKASLHSSNLQFQLDGKAKSLRASLVSQMREQNEPAGNIDAQLSLDNLQFGKGIDFAHSSMKLSAQVQNSSATFVETFLGRKGIKELLGPTLNFSLKGQSTAQQQNFSVKASSQYFNMNAALACTPEALVLESERNPAAIQWTLTPAGYLYLNQMLNGSSTARPFQLNDATVFNADITRLIFPLVSKEKTGSLCDRIPCLAKDLSLLQLVGQVRNDQLAFVEKKSGQVVSLNNFSIDFNKATQTGPIAFTSKGLASTGAAKSGQLSMSGTIDKIFNEQKTLDLKQLTTDSTIKIQQFPSAILDIFAKNSNPFSTVFGETINADFSIKLQNFSGPLKLNVNSPNTRASMVGQFNNGILTLNEPVYAQVTMTRDMSKLILQDVNPLSIDSITSQNPITLMIDSKGFSFPVYPYDVRQIAIPFARLELGQISCRNEGNINITLGLLKSKQFDKGRDLNLWFAPIDLHVKDGFTDFERTEILLADTFEIALWGKVDLFKDYIDMTLGLTAQCLKKAFGIKDLPAEYILQIPMKGPADNVQINTGTATAKIALLLAAEQKGGIAGAIGGGPAGAIVGELFNRAVKLPDMGTPAPAAKHPFPWEVGRKNLKSENEEEPDFQGKKRHFKAKEKPLKQILKIIR